MKKFYNQIKVKKWYAYLAISFAAITFTMGIQMFIQVAHTFTSGVSAIALLPTMLIDELAPYVGLLYLGLNLPLILFFWKKIKKDFILKTSFFLLIQAATGSLFVFDSVSDSLTNLIVDPDQVLTLIWPIFILAAIGGLFIGSTTAIAWKFGGSSGGSDIITYYFSTKKKVSVGLMAFIVSMSFVAVSFIITIIVKEELRSNAFSILMATIGYVAIGSLMVNILYPKYAKVLVEVHSKDTKKISDYLRRTKYIHSWQVRDVTSGFSGEKKHVITTVMLLLEFKEFKNNVIAIDPDAWLSTNKVRNLHGKFDTRNIE